MCRCCPQAVTKVLGTTHSMLPYSHKTHFESRLKPKTEREGVRIVFGKVGFEQVYIIRYALPINRFGRNRFWDCQYWTWWIDVILPSFSCFIGLFTAWQKCSGWKNKELILVNFVAGACGHTVYTGWVIYMHKINVGPKYIESCVARALLTTNNLRDGRR